jgi:uncharacterized membrane protein
MTWDNLTKPKITFYSRLHEHSKKMNMENLLLLIFAGLSIAVAVLAYYATHQKEE